MSDSRSRSSSPVPRAALDALLGDAVGANPIRRAMWLDELDRRLIPFLPPSLAAHARLANIDGDRLVYLVDSPVWHARLRLASNELIDAARSLGLDVSRFVVRTTRQMPGAQAPPEPATMPVSATARAAVRDALASLRGSGNEPAKDES
ncbi:MAG: DciA family protein [Achromobacter pestifer]